MKQKKKHVKEQKHGNRPGRLFWSIVGVPLLLLAAVMVLGRFVPAFSGIFLSGGGAILSGLLIYFSVVALALTMYQQNQQIQQTNLNYEKLSAMHFVSFINATYLSCKQMPPEVFGFERTRFQGKQIEFKRDNATKYFLIDFTARNTSDYPITLLNAKCAFCAGGMINYDMEAPVYISEHQTETLRVVIPLNESEQSMWDLNDDAFIALDIFATNAMEFTTKGMIFVHFVEKKQAEMTYHVAPVSETNPFLKSE